MTKKGWLGLAVVLWALGLATASLHAQAESPVAGTWDGTFRCGNGEGSLRLEISKSDTALQEGELHFEVQAARVAGSHRIRARYDDAKKSLTVIPAEWIERPSGWRAMGLTGMLADNGLAISGAVGGCDGGNAFSVRRMGGDGAGTVAVAAAADPLETPTGGPFEGHWRGHITCDAGRIAGSFDILQDGAVLSGLSTMAAPDGSLESRLLLAGEVAANGDAQLAGTENLNTFRNHQFLTFRQLTGLKVDGDRLVGKVERLNISARWKNCDRIALTRAGVPRTPVPDAAADLVGTWVGFDSFVQRREDLDRVDMVAEVATYAVPQVRLDIAMSGERLFGSLAMIAKSQSMPVDQPRSVVTLRPLVRLDDGRVGFIGQRVVRSDKGAPRNTALAGLLVLSIGADSSLLIERVRPKSRSDSFIRVARPQSDAALTALDAGEGPALPLPGVFGAAFATGETLDAQCRVFRDWLTSGVDPKQIGAMSVGVGTTRLLPLLRDDSFEPAFGLPYGFLSQAERKVLNAFGTEICPSRIGYDAGGRYAIDTVFGDDQEFNTIVGRLADQLDSRGWREEALAAIDQLPDEAGAGSVLDTMEREARTRSAELSAADNAALREAFASKRVQITVAELTAAVGSVAALPDSRATLDRIVELSARIRASDVPAGKTSDLSGPLRAKASGIVRQLADAALDMAKSAPRSIAGLAALTDAYRDIGDVIDGLRGDLQMTDGVAQRQEIGVLREALIAEPATATAFAGMLAGLSPGHSDPDATVDAAAFRYLDRSHYLGGSAVPVYAQAVRAATDELAIRSIDFADRSIQASPDEPTAREMLLAVKGVFDRISGNLKSTYTRCQNRAYGNDPMAAMECIAILSAGGGQAFSVRMIRFEKVGCAPGTIRAGHVCDYVLGISSSSEMMQGRFAELLGAGSRAQGRFVRTTEGLQFIPVR